MRILALEPFGAASHVAFLDGLVKSSRHEISVDTMPPRFWKWRMRTAAMGMVQGVVDANPDLLFVSDFLNLAELRALLPERLRSIPVVGYFHENQLTYPVREGERVDVHHGLTNIHSVLAAQHTLFNSEFHRDAFLEAANELLDQVPDMKLASYGRELSAKSSVLGLGTDLPMEKPRPLGVDEAPILVWNHRWEHDKDPEQFLEVLAELERRDFAFRLVLLGERFRRVPEALVEIEQRFPDQIVVSGFAASRGEYESELRRGHILVSTARHEFFGLSTLEGLCAGLVPVLPHDLAYPELLPEAMAKAPFLNERGAKAMADGVMEAAALLRDGVGALGMGDLALHLAQFQWNAIGARFDAVFDEVLESASGTRA